MNVFWKTFLGGMLCIALMFGGRYAKAWLGYKTYRSPEHVAQIERDRLAGERRMIAQTYTVTPGNSAPTNYTAPIKPPPFYTPPHKPPNNSRPYKPYSNNRN